MKEINAIQVELVLCPKLAVFILEPGRIIRLGQTFVVRRVMRL